MDRKLLPKKSFGKLFLYKANAIQKNSFSTSQLGIGSSALSIFKNTNRNLKILQVSTKCINYTNSN